MDGVRSIVKRIGRQSNFPSECAAYLGASAANSGQSTIRALLNLTFKRGKICHSGIMVRPKKKSQIFMNTRQFIGSSTPSVEKNSAAIQFSAVKDRDIRVTIESNERLASRG